ncbi:uncharacterized protein LOC132629834 [Lycium barbarum]|uniref:uncharacterized protein LOC132629834 n=1 Tax=Lycium barbarum TaxID=112863 RepID=UPI00293EAE9F|nr:uncharacterized protein LOC132629834 [Lycium barbarum]
MCWSSQVKLIFLEAIHQVMRKDHKNCKNFQLPTHFVAYWWCTRIQDQPASFEKVFYFPTDPRSPSRTHDSLYDKPNGVVFYARNFKRHSDFRLTMVIDVLERVIPELLSGVYLDLVETPFKNDVVWEVSETNEWTKTTVKEYLFRNPSFFCLD